MSKMSDRSKECLFARCDKITRRCNAMAEKQDSTIERMQKLESELDSRLDDIKKEQNHLISVLEKTEQHLINILLSVQKKRIFST